MKVIKEYFEYDTFIKCVDDSHKYIMPITEANLKRVAYGHDEKGYAIISASRQFIFKNIEGDVSLVPKSGYNEINNEQEVTDINNINTKNLRQDIRDKGYSYISVYGGFKEKEQKEATLEKSFIVFPFNVVTKEDRDFDNFFNDIMELRRKYNQEAILIKAPLKNARYYDPQTNKPTSDFEFTGVTLNDITKEYFTALKKWKSDFTQGKPQRFTYEAYIPSYPNNIMEAHNRTYNGELVRYYKL